jgi:hypothetical protein
MRIAAGAPTKPAAGVIATRPQIAPAVTMEEQTPPISETPHCVTRIATRERERRRTAETDGGPFPLEPIIENHPGDATHRAGEVGRVNGHGRSKVRSERRSSAREAKEERFKVCQLA